MPPIHLLVPKLGMDTTEAIVTTWLVQEGDPVDVGTPLVELETEKVNFTVESEILGVVRKIVQPSGSSVPVGGTLAILEPKARY